jgi:hypothetical protein
MRPTELQNEVRNLFSDQVSNPIKFFRSALGES